jgi:hypothetical protein
LLDQAATKRRIDEALVGPLYGLAQLVVAHALCARKTREYFRHEGTHAASCSGLTPGVI